MYFFSGKCLKFAYIHVLICGFSFDFFVNLLLKAMLIPLLKNENVKVAIKRWLTSNLENGFLMIKFSSKLEIIPTDPVLEFQKTLRPYIFPEFQRLKHFQKNRSVFFSGDMRSLIFFQLSVCHLLIYIITLNWLVGSFRSNTEPFVSNEASQSRATTQPISTKLLF